MKKFGELKKVPLRDIWAHEAIDFTPWLASNIEHLGDALGLELELTKREASLGDFSLDLLAKDLASSKIAVIENQLTKTDHDHLGKLLTYAAGFNASIVIWLSEVIREEHRQAIEWLNQRTDTDTQFFAVVVEVLQIDDSSPAFNFKPVVFPNEWQKTKKQSTTGITSTKGEKYRTYFQTLIDDLREIHHFTGARVGQPQSWYFFTTGIQGISYGASFALQGKVRSELYLDQPSQEANKALFDLLKKHEEKVNLEFGEPLEWERLDNKRASRIAIYCNGNIELTGDSLSDIRAWHINNLLKFKEMLTPLIKKTLKNINA